MIESNAQLSELFHNMVITQIPMNNNIYSDIMQFILDKDMKHAEEINKWIMNCDKLMRKLNENQ